MLVLSRKQDEKIMIGDSISVMVVEIRGDKARLGIEAPEDMTIHREEVYLDIQENGSSIYDPSNRWKSADEPPVLNRPVVVELQSGGLTIARFTEAGWQDTRSLEHVKVTHWTDFPRRVVAE